MAPPPRRRQILSDSADVAAVVPGDDDEMALIGGRCTADSDCSAAAKGSVCGREHGRCECGDWMEFDIATQECRGETKERYVQALSAYSDRAGKICQKYVTVGVAFIAQQTD